MNDDIAAPERNGRQNREAAREARQRRSEETSERVPNQIGRRPAGWVAVVDNVKEELRSLGDTVVGPCLHGEHERLVPEDLETNDVSPKLKTRRPRNVSRYVTPGILIDALLSCQIILRT